ncbi:hypothetical protein KC363_g73 [Hortaea werneckii]|nr:hypothetical protein KC363_g73 [Hortaea werneckii]
MPPSTRNRVCHPCRLFPESESDIVLWIQCGHVEHTDLGESRFRSPYEKPQGYQSATVGDRRVTHAQASPESDLYSDEPSYADTSSQDDHEGLQRNVCGGEEGQRVRNVVGFKIGVFNKGTGCDETNVRFINATELHDTIRMVSDVLRLSPADSGSDDEAQHLVGMFRYGRPAPVLFLEHACFGPLLIAITDIPRAWEDGTKLGKDQTAAATGEQTLLYLYRSGMLRTRSASLRE